MVTIKHVLFPFDFSAPGKLAARFVRTVAGRFQARVTLMSILPPVWSVPVVGMPAIVPGDLDAAAASLHSELEKALPEELAGLTVDRVTEHGDPAARILDFADSHAVDLIMMPTHGFGLFRSFLIGSVTAKVLHDARCPVWTATHAEEQHSPDQPKNIVCAVDRTKESIELTRFAAAFGQAMGASVKLVHVVQPVSDWLAMASERELQEQVREAARVNVQALLRTAGVDLPLRVAVGQIVDTVTEEARQEGAEMMIIGRGSLQSPLGRLRTHAYAMIQRSPCPVLSV